MSEETMDVTVAGIPFSGVAWMLVNGTDPEELGFIYEFLSADDPDCARDQIHKNYAHGGGWRRFEGFELKNHTDADLMRGRAVLQYAGDPPMKMKAITLLHGDLVIFFDYAWCCILKDDGSYEVARLD